MNKEKYFPEEPDVKVDYEEGFNNLSLAAMAKMYQDDTQRQNLLSLIDTNKD